MTRANVSGEAAKDEFVFTDGLRQIVTSGVAEAEWEHPLEAALRHGGFQARTERVYREWASRFVRFVGPRSIANADECALAQFLTALAVQHQASRTAQKTARNALTFFLRALGRSPNNIVFERAKPRRPTMRVLAREEFDRLRRHLDGATLLVAELGGATDLRLDEVLRLRVRDVDLAEKEIRASGGKLGVARAATLPDRLVAAFENHLERLLQLHRLDRAAGLAGVAAPAEVINQEPAAGMAFDWQWLFPSRELGVEQTTGLRRRHHLTGFRYERTLRFAGVRARLGTRVTPPLLRHSFAVYGGG